MSFGQEAQGSVFVMESVIVAKNSTHLPWFVDFDNGVWSVFAKFQTCRNSYVIFRGVFVIFQTFEHRFEPLVKLIKPVNLELDHFVGFHPGLVIKALPNSLH